MKEHKSQRAHDTADKGCSHRGAEQFNNTTQLIEFEWRAAKSLDQPRDNEGAARIGHRKKCRAGKIAIAHQIGCESGDDHAGDDRQPYGRAERHQESRGDARSRPEHRDAIRLVEQRQAKTRGEEENDRDGD